MSARDHREDGEHEDRDHGAAPRSRRFSARRISCLSSWLEGVIAELIFNV
jgi:hypothetical protein